MIGGWWSFAIPTSSREVFWFSTAISVRNLPKDLHFNTSRKSKNIAALELLAQLVLLRSRQRSHLGETISLQISQLTDSQVCSHVVGKLYARTYPLAAVLQEMVLDSLQHHRFIALGWLPGKKNTWADFLSRTADSSQLLRHFDPQKRVIIDPHDRAWWTLLGSQG